MRRCLTRFRAAACSALVVASGAVGVGRRRAPAPRPRRHARQRGLRVRERELPRLDRRHARCARPIVAMATTADGKGYWQVAADGGIFSFNAPFYGALAGWPLAQPVVGMTATPSGSRLLDRHRRRIGVPLRRRASRTARSSAVHLNAPIKALDRRARRARATGSTRPTAACSRSAPRASTARRARCASTRRSSAWRRRRAGNGYWLVASDGGIFSFGDAHFYGSTGAMHLNAPVVGMARDGSGNGYWLAGADGGVFTFGDAHFKGSAAGQVAGQPARRAARRHARRQRLPHAGAARTSPDVGLMGLGATRPGRHRRPEPAHRHGLLAARARTASSTTTCSRPSTRSRRRTACRAPARSTRPTQAKFRTATRPRAAVDARFDDRDRQDPPDPARRHERRGPVHVQRVDRLRSPVHARRRAATPRTRPKACSRSSARSTGPTTARSARCGGPKYFTWSGIAVHGYTSVPPYPASHGCTRVSNDRDELDLGEQHHADRHDGLGLLISARAPRPARVSKRSTVVSSCTSTCCRAAGGPGSSGGTATR